MSEIAINLISSAAASTLFSTILIWIFKSWISERLKNAIKNEYDEKLETHKAQLKAQADVESERLRARLSIIATQYQTELANHAWLSQQQWGIREQKYAELLKHLTKLRVAVHAQDEFFIGEYDPHDQDWMRSVSENSYFRELASRISEEEKALLELIGPASIFLSDKTIAALDEMHAENFSIANYSAHHLADYVEQTRKVIDAAYEAVLQEARSELVHYRNHPRTSPSV